MKFARRLFAAAFSAVMVFSSTAFGAQSQEALELYKAVEARHGSYDGYECLL